MLIYQNVRPEAFSWWNCEAAVLLFKAFLCPSYKNVCSIKSVILALLLTVLQYVTCRWGLRRLGFQTIICAGFQPPLGGRISLCYLMFQRTVSTSHRLVCPIIYFGPPSKADNFQPWLSLLRKHKNRIRIVYTFGYSASYGSHQAFRLASDLCASLWATHQQHHAATCELVWFEPACRVDTSRAALFPSLSRLHHQSSTKHVVFTRLNDVETFLWNRQGRQGRSVGMGKKMPDSRHTHYSRTQSVFDPLAVSIPTVPLRLWNH